MAGWQLTPTSESKTGALHTEVISRDGTTGGVAILCRCVIARDHRYEDWLELPGNEEALERARRVWERPLLTFDGEAMVGVENPSQRPTCPLGSPLVDAAFSNASVLLRRSTDPSRILPCRAPFYGSTAATLRCAPTQRLKASEPVLATGFSWFVRLPRRSCPIEVGIERLGDAPDNCESGGLVRGTELGVRLL